MIVLMSVRVLILIGITSMTATTTSLSSLFSNVSSNHDDTMLKVMKSMTVPRVMMTMPMSRMKKAMLMSRIKKTMTTFKVMKLKVIFFS